MPTKNGNPHHPPILRTNYKEIKDKLVASVEKGLPPRNAFRRCGLTDRQYYDWRDWVEEDIEAGITDSPLVKLFIAIAEADEKNHENLVEKGFEMADEGDSSMIQFLLKTRYGYKDKKKAEVEISNNKKAPVTFNIVDMKPLESDEE